MDELRQLTTWEFSLWLAKYQRQPFGPSVNAQYQAQIAWITSMVWGGKAEFQQFLIQLAKAETAQDEDAAWNALGAWFESVAVKKAS